MYDEAVDAALATYRGAVQNVQQFAAPDEHSADSLEQIGAIAARSSEKASGDDGDELFKAASDEAELLAAAHAAMNGTDS
jgi:hypothetical protein